MTCTCKFDSAPTRLELDTGLWICPWCHVCFNEDGVILPMVDLRALADACGPAAVTDDELDEIGRVRL